MKPFITIKELKDKITNGEISPSESIAFFKERIKNFNSKINAVLESFENTSSSEGPLTGIPGIIKDNIAQKGHIASCGSNMLSNHRSTYDATITTRLKDSGATILGRSNMDEFAMGSSGEFSAYGATYNPWNLKHSPGGSSSGSAAAVSAGLVPWSIGTETGGSVRQPAAFCNLVGLYPTYGRFSRYGLTAFASSTDQPGPITRTVYDNALIASIMSGNDPKDPTSVAKPKQDFTRNLNGKIPEGLTIGIIEDSLKADGIHPEVKENFDRVIKELEGMGIKTKVISLPDIKYGISVYFAISRAEAASNLSRFDGSLYGSRKDADNLFDMYLKTRHDGFGSEVKRRVLMGNYVLSAGHKDAFYHKAEQLRALIRSEFENAFREVDLLISPTVTSLPFEINKECNDPLALYMSDYFTVPMCVAGVPALTLPSGLSQNGLPLAFQFVGPHLSEELIYQVAHAYQERTDYHTKTPPGF